jgi:hypothetical protein
LADKTWKAFERRLARCFGTERIPAAGVMGHAQKDAADFKTQRISFQAKKGYHQPSYLRSWLHGIVQAAAAEDRIGAVVWGAKGCKDGDSLVFLRLEDFAKLVREIDAAKDGAADRGLQPGLVDDVS